MVGEDPDARYPPPPSSPSREFISRRIDFDSIAQFRKYCDVKCGRYRKSTGRARGSTGGRSSGSARSSGLTAVMVEVGVDLAKIACDR
jgi:hypothetical protein